MAYIDINGQSTWAQLGEPGRQAILLLHGGLANSDSMLDSVGRPLGAHYRIAAFDRRGHGRTADTDAPFHYETMADETIGVLEQLGGASHIVGWSDGGIIALSVAMRRPDLVDRMVLIGANYHYSGVRGQEADTDDAAGDEFLAALRQSYAERSPDGVDHFDAVVAKSFTLFASEPTFAITDLHAITTPTLVMVGDDDVVDLAHTCAMYEAMPNAQLAVVPAASHALPMEQPDEAARIILRFLTSTVPPTTLMPSRRAVARQR
jgi:pimeloyl-ACP methyl ester carboxylesterase